MSKFYLLKERGTNKNFDQLLEFSNDQLIRLSFSNHLEGNYQHYFLNRHDSCTVMDQESPFDALFERSQFYAGEKKNKQNYDFVELTNAPGIFYPHIFRPLLKSEMIYTNPMVIHHRSLFPFVDYVPQSNNHLISSINQLSIMVDDFEQVSNNIHPSAHNLDVYGNNLKKLLIIACIEFESQATSILKLNNFKTQQQNYNYNSFHFLKLKSVLKLDRYKVFLTYFPHLGSFDPFSNWEQTGGSTKTLEWYYGYNQVKHNGEEGFEKANLSNVINSMCAVAILIKAQYGDKIRYWNEKIGNFFEIKFEYEWGFKERLLPPFKNETWQVLNCNFD